MPGNGKCHESSLVLDVTDDYFSVFFGEAGMINTIKSYNSAIAASDSSFRFDGCIQNESMPKIW